MITLEQFIGIFVAISAVGGGLTVIWKVIKPLKAIFERVEELERRDKLDYERSIADHRLSRMQASAIATICLHLRDGNHTGELGKIAAEMTQELIRP